MRKNSQDTELSRQHILSAAEKVFGRSGYVGANMDEIARLTGMTKGAIFWHYGNKLGLFKAVLEKAARRVREIIDQSLTTRENILTQFQKIMLAIQRDLAFKVLLQLGSADTERGVPRSALNTLRREVAAIFRDMHKRMEKARRSGELKANANTMEILFTLILFMSGFTLIEKIKDLLMIEHSLDSAAATHAIFAGLNSYQR